MKYVFGIDIDSTGATIAMVQEDGSLLPVHTDEGLAFFPKQCAVTPTGEVLVGTRARRYNRLHDLAPQAADDAAFFVHLKQVIRSKIGAETPDVVLSMPTLDPHAQRSLVHAACTAGLRVLRCIDRATACAAAHNAREQDNWRRTLVVAVENGGFFINEAEGGDGVLEILSCKACKADDCPADAVRFERDGSPQDARIIASHGAAIYAATLSGFSSLPPLLLMDILPRGFSLLKNDGSLLTFASSGTTIPVRHIRYAAPDEILDENNCLLYAFCDDHILPPVDHVTIADERLRNCAELEITLSVSANRKTELTVKASDSGVSESFVLLDFAREAASPDPVLPLTETRMLDALLSAMDSLENGLRMISDEERNSAIGKGMLQIHKQFTEALRNMGIEPVPAEGCLFDPELHEAVVSMPGEHPGWVLQEYRRGYMRNGMLLRAAQVMVTD